MSYEDYARSPQDTSLPAICKTELLMSAGFRCISAPDIALEEAMSAL